MKDKCEVCDLQAELDATNRQVEILSDALAESRREVAALKAVQEPAAWEDVLGAIARGWTHPENAQKPMDVQLAVAIAKEIQDMYTTPPAAQRQWVGLTAGERDALFTKHYQWDDYGKAIEAKLREKNA
jgi:hypothetical protein